MVRFHGSSIAFPFNRKAENDPKARLALALYREGITVNSIPFSFLSLFKILNIFWKDKYVSGHNEIIEGIRSNLKNVKNYESEKRINEIRASGADVAKYLYESCRCAIAHAYADPIIDPDDVADLMRLSKDLEIKKEIAENLIENRLGISRKIYG